MTSAPRGRSSIKSGTGSTWKDQLREECFSRLQFERSKLLSQARHARAQGQGDVTLALRNIISASSAHIQGNNGGGAAAQPIQAFGSSPGTTAVTPARAGGLVGGAATPFHDNGVGGANVLPQSSELDNLSVEDYQELMQANFLTLEKALYEDMLREEAEYLDSLEQKDVEVMVENYFDSHGGTPPEGPAVPCPICQEAYLVEHQGVVLCPQRHLRLDTSIEGLRLEDVRQRLATAFSLHASHGCRCRPLFEQRGSMGVTSLVMCCTACGMLEVVV